MKLNYLVQFIDGVFCAEDSDLPKGVDVDANAVVTVTKNAKVELPIFTRVMGHCDKPVEMHIIACEGASALFVQQYDVELTGIHVIKNIRVEKGAILNLMTMQCGNNNAQTTNVVQHGDSQFNHYQLSISGQKLRHQLNINLDKPGASCVLNGIYLLSEKQTADHDILIHHNSAHTQSQQHYRGILDDESKATFRGKVVVAKDAQQIQANQGNHNLLLSKSAVAESKPELEIYADDVKCSHGATVGQLDESALFYLRARGISDKDARQILTRGFVQDVLTQFPKLVQPMLLDQHPLLEAIDARS